MASLFPCYKRENRTRERGGLKAPAQLGHLATTTIATVSSQEGTSVGWVGDVCGGGENITLHRLWALSPPLW